MSTRYEDTQRDDSRRSVNGADAGGRLRRDVRDTGRDLSDAGGDIVRNWCGLWGNLLSGIGDALSPSARSRTSSNIDDREDDSSQSFFFCDSGEFRISCGPSRSSRSDRSDDRDNEKGDRTVARYADRKREAEIKTNS